MSSQINDILYHLKSGKPITSMQAYELYGCTRLPSRIFDLREMGYNITSITRKEINRYGNVSSFAEYRLVDSIQKGGVKE